MALASHAPTSHLSSRLRRRQLRKLSDELARLETAARAARSQRRRLEQGASGASRAVQVLSAARRREEALRIAIGDCRAEIFKQLVRGARWEDDDAPSG